MTKPAMLLRLSVLLGAVFSGAGCSDGSDACPQGEQPGTETIYTCDYRDTLRINSQEFALPMSFPPATTCSKWNGRFCELGPHFYFQTAKREDGHYFSFGVSLVPTTAPGTYALNEDQGEPHIYAEIHSASFGDSLLTESGTLTVVRNDLAGFAGSLDLHLVTADGNFRVAVAGDVVTSDCGVDSRPICTF
jgi:hypothetical protein